MEKYIKIFLKSFKRLVALSNSLIINFFSRFNQNFFKKTSTNISIFNKILITFITTLFCYLFFLTLPNLYDKSWVQKTLKSKGYRARIYIPYGKAWLPYTLRRLAEKKENLLFVFTHLFRETFGLRKLH